MKFTARVSLEEMVADEPAVVPEVPVEEVVDGSESVEEAVAIAEDEANVVDSGVETGEQASEDAEKLEEIAEILEASEETGGADPVAIQLAEVTVESFRQRYNISQKVLPSMESFSDSKTRKAATKVAVENLKEVAKGIWAKIVALYKKIAGWVTSFVKYVFDANHRMGEEFKKLGAVKLEGTAKNATFDAPELGKALHVGGKVTSAGVAKSLANAAEVADYALDVAMSFINQVSATDIDATLAGGLDNVKYNFKAINASKGFTKAPAGYGNVADGVEAMVSTEMAGGKVVLVHGMSGTKVGAEAVTAAKSFTVKVVPVYGSKDFEGKAVPTATSAEISAIATNGVKLMTVMSNKKSASDSITKAVKEFSTQVEAAAKTSKVEDGVVRPIQGLAQAFGRNMVEVMKAAFGYNMTVAKNALHYAQKSVKQYGEAAAPKADKKAAA